MSSLPPPLFQHSPLDSRKREIRVLKFQSTGEDSSPGLLTFCLEHVSLAEAPRYDALSYVWGNPNPNKKIKVNSALFDVTQNLFDALQELAIQNYERLWVDAICINQADIDEKNSQLPLMRQIYSMSCKTIVWLGVAYNESDLAFDHLNLVSKLEATVLTSGSSWERSLSQMQTLKSEDEDTQKRIISSLVSLYARPYWRRTWIIQEVCLASDAIVKCGSKSMPWTIFSSATYRLPGQSRMAQVSEADFTGTHTVIRLSRFRRGLGHQEDHFINSDKSKARVIESSGGVLRVYQSDDILPEVFPAPDLLEALLLCNFAQATNPRDHLYGLLGLARDASSMIPSPDYSKSVAELFTEFTWATIRKTKNIDIICLGQKHFGRIPGLPSWVWDVSNPLGLSMTLNNWSSDVYRACGDNEHYETGTNYTGESLTAKGFVLDFVDGLGAVVDPTGAIKSPIVQPDYQTNAYGTPEAVVDALWRCFVLGARGFEESPEFFFTAAPPVIFEAARRQEMDPNLDPELSPWCNSTSLLQMYGKTLRQWMDEWFPYLTYRAEDFNRQYPRLPLGPSCRRGLQNFNTTSMKYAGSFRNTIQHKRMLVTKRGYVGMAPHLAEKGDVIAALFGCKVPVVLRPLTRGIGYEVVGEAYVKGFMKGEGVDGINESDVSEFILA